MEVPFYEKAVTENVQFFGRNVRRVCITVVSPFSSAAAPAVPPYLWGVLKILA